MVHRCSGKHIESEMNREAVGSVRYMQQLRAHLNMVRWGRATGAMMQSCLGQLIRIRHEQGNCRRDLLHATATDSLRHARQVGGGEAR